MQFTAPQLISMAAGIGVPLAVGLLTKSSAPRWLKSFLNVLLTTLAGAVTTVIVASNTSFPAYLTDIGLAWVTSIASYYGFHRPTGLAGTFSAITGNVGLTATRTDPFFGRRGPGQAA